MEDKVIDISIVIPVYNGEVYLEETLDSLRAQTWQSYEIICVDDGSNDGTLDILKQYQKEDNRIVLLNQDHKGAGEARNLGLKKASGEYIVFLDADDIFLNTMLEKIVKKGKETKADVILFGAKRYDNRTKMLIEVPGYLRRELLPKEEWFSVEDMKEKLFSVTTPSPWTKAFRREYVLQEQIWFQNLANSNDVFFVLTAMASAKRLAAIREDFTYYRVFREGSLQNRKDKSPLCFLEAYEAVFDELHRRGIYKKVAQGFADLVLSGCVYNLNSVKTREAYWRIADALCSDRFLRMGLLDYPDEEYQSLDNRNLIQGLPHAIRVKEELQKNYQPEWTERKSQTDMEAKVSVVIPVHNTSKYLAECLDSVRAQTLKEIEIICINDASTDTSLEMLCEYADRDVRISVYSQKHCGLSVTRNRGLIKASGEYIYFMDSDDILDESALEDLYRKSTKNHLDILYFDAETMYETEEMKQAQPEFMNYYMRNGIYPTVCSGQEMYSLMRSTREYRVNVGIQFFRRKFLMENQLVFEPGIYHEDNAFTFASMLLADRVGYCEQPYFHRRVRSSSIVTKKTSFEHVYGYFRCFITMLDFVKSYDYPEIMTESIYDGIQAVLSNAKRQYTQLDAAEKYAYLGLESTERMLFRLYIEKGESLYAKLQRTYDEKSEINRKLQITYGEKYERGLEIKRLKKEIASIKRSKTYRLARMIGYPIRMIRKLCKKGQN